MAIAILETSNPSPCSIVSVSSVSRVIDMPFSIYCMKNIMAYFAFLLISFTFFKILFNMHNAYVCYTAFYQQSPLKWTIYFLLTLYVIYTLRSNSFNTNIVKRRIRLKRGHANDHLINIKIFTYRTRITANVKKTFVHCNMIFVANLITIRK